MVSQRKASVAGLHLLCPDQPGAVWSLNAQSIPGDHVSAKQLSLPLWTADHLSQGEERPLVVRDAVQSGWHKADHFWRRGSVRPHLKGWDPSWLSGDVT